MSDAESRWVRFRWLFAAVWLVFLNGNLTALLAHPGGWQRDLGLVALAGFGVVYVASSTMMRGVRHALPAEPPPSVVWRVWLTLVTLLVLAALQVPGAGHHALNCLVYVAGMAMVTLPLRLALPTGVVLVALAEGVSRLVPGWADHGYGYSVFFSSVAAWGIRMAIERQRRLLRAQEELAALAVANERARIATDLHDILGHSLTVVTVKAELAQRLLDVDVDKARTELRDLEALARDALADVRATALGVRGISLPGEIAAARSALAAASVAAELPGAADEVPSRFRELFAWTIREAVTNVVRHSRATRCEVRLSADSVEIVDDGVGSDPAASGGQGLAGLHRRAEALGARLSAGRRDDRPGFRVRVEAPS